MRGGDDEHEYPMTQLEIWEFEQAMARDKDPPDPVRRLPSAAEVAPANDPEQLDPEDDEESANPRGAHRPRPPNPGGSPMTRADEATPPSGVMGPTPPEVQGRKLRPVDVNVFRYAKHG